MKVAVTNSTSLSPGILAAFAGLYIIWGTTYLGIAIAIQSLPPFISGAIRFLVAGALVAIWLRWRTPRPFAGVNLPVAALCGVLLSGIGNGFVIWAQQGIPSGIAALIVAAMPVVVLGLDWAWFSRKAPTRQGLVGTAVALIGVAVIVLHTRTLAGAASPLHLLSMVVAVVGWSIGTLLQRGAAGRDQVLSFTGAQMLFGGLFQLLLSVFDGEWASFNVHAVTLSSWLALVYLVIFGSLIGLNCYLWLLTRVPAAKVTTYALVNPVVALILGALVLDEAITSTAVIAALLVLFGVSLVLFQDRMLLRRRSAPTAECE